MSSLVCNPLYHNARMLTQAQSIIAYYKGGANILPSHFRKAKMLELCYSILGVSDGTTYTSHQPQLLILGRGQGLVHQQYILSEMLY